MRRQWRQWHGSRRHAKVQVARFADLSERTYLADLSKLTRLEAELAHSASHDSLTGLANRRELFEALETSLASDASAAVLFFDLDDFKVVNDSLGHAVGDDVLRQLSLRIRESVRGDDVVGRLGGDEFLVICRGVSQPDEAVAIAEDILRCVVEPIQIGQRELFVTGSIGVTIARSDVGRVTAQSLIQEADIAMYRAKAAGRRRVVLFDASMRKAAIDRLEMERELRLALERDEFELYFQPVVYIERPTVWNFEALIRWNHPEHGLMMPGDFLPMVEEVGLTKQVGQWVLSAAVAAVAAMRAIEPNACVGINVDPEQLRESDFLDRVAAAIAEAGVPGTALAIEITEHAVMNDVDRVRTVLEELRDMGVSIAIDDFGTGYSNFGLLRRLPVDFLKIDRSFITGLGVEPGDMQVVRMIIALSHELGIEVIAEGVETPLQSAELHRLGCRIVQGYLFARPGPLESALARLRDR